MKINRSLFICTVIAVFFASQSQGQTIYVGEARPLNRDVNVADSRVNGPAFGGDRGTDNPLNSANVITSIAGGVGSVQRGMNSALQNVTINIDHVINGFVAIEGNLNGNNVSFPAFTTVVNGDDDPNVSAVTGINSTDSRNSRRGAPLAATYFISRHTNPTTLGSFTFNEGTFIGGDDHNGGRFEENGGVTINGTAFIGGDRTEADRRTTSTLTENNVWGDTAGLVAGNSTASLTINNKTRSASYFDIIQGGNGLSANLETIQNSAVTISGGAGLLMSGGTLDIKGGDFMAGNSGALLSIGPGQLGIASNLTAVAEGSDGAYHSGSTTISDGYFTGGDAGDVIIDGDLALARVSGGRGLYNSGNATISTGTFIAGDAGQATVDSVTSAKAIAQGGHAISLNTGSHTIDYAETTSTRGGVATARGITSAIADAMGGNGIYAMGTTALTINDGIFRGADGGFASGETLATADGGSGVRINAGLLTINGGTFSGAKAGTATGPNAFARAGRGIWAEGSSVKINDATGTKTVINDGIYFSNSGTTLDILGGTINGGILFDGTGSPTVTVSSNATFTGAIVQDGGTVNVTLGAGASSFFKDVEIDGTMDFNSDFNSAAGTIFTLANTNSAVEFNSLRLAGGSQIQAGGGTVDVTVGDLVVGDGSSLNFAYDGGWSTNGISPTSGRARIIGGLIMTNTGARITLSGAAATTTGSVAVVAAGTNTLFGANNPNEVIQANLGWLVKTNNVDSTAGVTVEFGYNSLTNHTELADLGTTLLSELDAAITDTNYINKGKFLALNSNGKAAGEQLIRYSTTQIPDVADAAFQTQLQVSEVAAARGSEFRSMNGYASSKPNFGRTAPQGAAGPNEGGESDMQGWMRGYGSFSSRDTEGTFTDYDSQAYGVVVGVDKSFGNLLIGLAGGYGNVSIDAGTTYDADVNNYHGTLYSTFGGESTYVDLALTYGISDTKVNNIVADDTFDSHSASAYIGAGKSFCVGEKLKITPEASLLTSHYTQDEYDRAGLVMMSIKEYDEWSYLGSLGLNLATTHQMDWLNMGFALIPEFRVHWIHEFNTDLADFTYISSGTTKTFGVRSREEDLLKVGAGVDMWNWSYQNAKLEVDYDGVSGKDYEQHTLSLKGTIQF